MDRHDIRRYDSVLGLLSSEDNPTPLVRLNRVVPFKHAVVYAKLEWYNPFGAVKDRIAANMIADAEASGAIGAIRKLVEPTSGNTGMGLAMMANARNLELTTPLSRAIPEEKRAVLRFFGSNVIELDDNLCPAPGAPEGAIATAMDLAARPDFYMLNQYDNLANPAAHMLTTGPEIWKQTEGEITHFVAGLGTCGTITGNGRFLKKKNADIKIFGVHPSEGHDIPGVRSIRQLQQTKLFFPDEYDQLIEINDKEAFPLCARLNREESLIAGPSSAMALAGALKLVPDEPGVVAVVIFPDNIFKYTTTIRRHLPALFPSEELAAPAAGPDPLLGRLLDNARSSIDNIDMGRMEDLMDDGETVLIDVRDPATFAQEHAQGAINVPLGQLEHSPPGLPADRSASIVTICTAGVLSLHALLVLRSLGYTNVLSLAGGMGAWRGEGYPTEP